MDSKMQFSQLTEEFLKVNNLITQIQKKPINITSEYKLSTSMIHLIDLVGKYPGKTITELAELLGVTKGAISQQIPVLKKIGLIEISQKKDNKKNKFLSLTSEGEKVFDAHNSLHEELYSSIQARLTSFSPEQIQTIHEILEIISISINDYQEKLAERKNK